MDFDACFKLLINNEGKLSLDPKDRGNWDSGKVNVGNLKGTKYGISAMMYPKEDIKNLTLSRAKELYKRDFWDTIQLSSLPEEIVFDMFDTAVNSGIGRAVILLQRTLGIKEDGLIGPNTIKLAHSCPLLRQWYNAIRLQYMTDCASWNTNGKGWARRVASNLLLNINK